MSTAHICFLIYGLVDRIDKWYLLLAILLQNVKHVYGANTFYQKFDWSTSSDTYAAQEHGKD